MTDISRFSSGSDAIELEFVKCEATPIKIMEFVIHLHLTGLSLSNQVLDLDSFGIDRARLNGHN